MSGERQAGADSLSPRTVGITTGVATSGFLSLGLVRGFDLDSSITTSFFIATKSVGDAFTTGFVFNNHVFFSFLDHLVYSATGSQAPWLLRLLPLLFAGVAVGLVAAAIAARSGTVPAIAAAALIATNPTFANVSTQVRGYSLLTLCAVVCSLILMRALRSETVSTRALVVYAVAGAVGIATHGYMVWILGIHGLMALSNWRVAQRFITAWAGTLLGIAAYIWIWRYLREAIGASGKLFRPTFPLHLAVGIAGGSIAAAVPIAALALPAVWEARRIRRLHLALAGLVIAVGAMWVLAPADLYVRFFIWLVPLPAIAAARTMARGLDRHGAARAITVVAVVVAIGVQLWHTVPVLRNDEFGNRQAAEAFARVNSTRPGGIPCVAGDFEFLRMIGYPEPFGSNRQVPLQQCVVLVALHKLPPRAMRLLRTTFPHHQRLEAEQDGTLWSRVPTSCWLGPDSQRPKPAACRMSTTT
ncbi:MAG: hypothetical protein U0Q22_15215 [Acidimicrobiales bacterium]